MNLTVRDAATMLDVPERAIYRWIREKSIPVHKAGDQYRFHRAELLEWATSRGMRISPAEFQGAAVTGGAMPLLSDALEAGGVHRGIVATDRGSLLRAVVDVMPIEDADRDLLYDFLLAREALGSTGVGDGIAIPHVRNPVVIHVQRPNVTLCFLERPIDFQSVDGQPVHTVFSLVSGTVRGHLYLLSRLSAALHDPGFKNAVLQRAPDAQILEEARRVEAKLAPTAGAGPEP